jgi:hypothetical protein
LPALLLRDQQVQRPLDDHAQVSGRIGVTQQVARQLELAMLLGSETKLQPIGKLIEILE